MHRILATLFLTFSLLLGCKQKNPEDGFFGREHWVTTRIDKGTIYYMYDLGSVRRAENKVIVKSRKIDDIDFELSEKNQKRQLAGLPLYLGASGTMVFDCRKRSYRGASVTADYDGGINRRIPDSKELIVEPNSGVEEMFDALCVKQGGIFG